MAKVMDLLLPILSNLGHWAIILGSFGGPGKLHYHNPQTRLFPFLYLRYGNFSVDLLNSNPAARRGCGPPTEKASRPACRWGGGGTRTSKVPKSMASIPKEVVKRPIQVGATNDAS